MSGSPEAPLEVDAATFQALRDDGRPHAVLDVREPWEVEICGFAGAIRVPLASLPAARDRIPDDRPVIVVCHHGQRSLVAADFLRKSGLPLASSLRGGVDAWAVAVDPGMQRY